MAKFKKWLWQIANKTRPTITQVVNGVSYGCAISLLVFFSFLTFVRIDTFYVMVTTFPFRPPDIVTITWHFLPFIEMFGVLFTTTSIVAGLMYIAKYLSRVGGLNYSGELLIARIKHMESKVTVDDTENSNYAREAMGK